MVYHKIIINVKKKFNRLFSFKNMFKILFPLLAVTLVYRLKVENLYVLDRYKLRLNLKGLWIKHTNLIERINYVNFSCKIWDKTLVQQKS